MSTIVRKYEELDFKSVKEILVKSFPEVNTYLLKSLKNDKALNFDGDKYIQLVATLEERVVGYALVSRHFDPILTKCNFWIDYVCVSEEYRGRGIGRKLLQKIEDIAVSEKVLFLQLTSSRFRTSARNLYMDMGYEIRESDIFRKVLEW